MIIPLKKLLPVLIGIHLVAVPLYARIQPLVFLIVLLLTIWSLLIITEKVRQPSDFVRILTLVFSVFLLILSHGTIFGQLPGTSLLLILALLKIFEIRGKRDVSIIIFMCYFLIASNFFYNQDISLAIYVFLIVTYLSSVLIYMSDTLGTISFRQRMGFAGQFVLIAIPFMLILFVMFPRIPSPLWGLPKDTLSAKTGLSEELTLDNISQLVSSGEVAFRAVFNGEPPPNNMLYWRGPVLSHFDGTTWRSNYAPETAQANLSASANTKTYDYTVTLEPHNKKWLLALEHPTASSPDLRLTRELQLVSKSNVSNVVSYALTSSIGLINRGLFDQERSRNLQLPDKANPRSKAFALSLMQETGSENRRFVDAVLSYFRNEQFFYSLSPPPLGQHSIDDFLFETRKGFCGHYASAFVTLMRSAGIPSRIVTGYQGGTLNPLDNYMIIRQSDAHAWAEVWLDDKGWFRVDPTAAVSPERIESGVADAGLEENKLPSVIISDNAFLQRSRYLIDSAQNSWNKWIIGYNKKRQEQLFENLGIEHIDSGKLVLWLVIAMTLSGGIVAVFMLRSRNTDRSDKALLYYNIFCSRFRKAGLVRAVNEGELEFLQRIQKTVPSSARAAEIITNSYQQIRYNNRTDVRYLKNFILTVKNFRPVISQ